MESIEFEYIHHSLIVHSTWGQASAGNWQPSTDMGTENHTNISSDSATEMINKQPLYLKAAMDHCCAYYDDQIPYLYMQGKLSQKKQAAVHQRSQNGGTGYCTIYIHM